MIRVTVPRPVAEALMSGSLRLLVVDSYWPPGFVTDEDHPPAPRYDVARAIEAGERIGIDVECETCEGRGHIEADHWDLNDPNNHLGWVPCDCTDGRVSVGSVLPVEVLPIVGPDECEDQTAHICVQSHWMVPAVLHHTPLDAPAEDGRTEHVLTHELAYHDPASLPGKYAIKVEDARREP